jgi:hypothetical protein
MHKVSLPHVPAHENAKKGVLEAQNWASFHVRPVFYLMLTGRTDTIGPLQAVSVLRY